MQFEWVLIVSANHEKTNSVILIKSQLMVVYSKRKYHTFGKIFNIADTFSRFPDILIITENNLFKKIPVVFSN